MSETEINTDDETPSTPVCLTITGMVPGRLWMPEHCYKPAVWRFRFQDLSPDQPLSGDYCERHARFWFSSPRYLSAVPIP